MANVVGPKGQVVIDKHIRDQLGIRPGWLAVQMVIDDHIEIHFVPPEHSESLRGSLARYSNVRIADDEAFHRATEEAWAQGVREDELASAPMRRAE